MRSLLLKVVVSPTFVQRVVWTHDVREGNPTNEELAFNTKDSVPGNIDVAVSYMLDIARVLPFEAKKRVAIAEGEAAANRALASSLDERLLSWERLKLQRTAIEKWNGQMPSVMGGDGGGMLFNVPMPAGAAGKK